MGALHITWLRKTSHGAGSRHARQHTKAGPATDRISQKRRRISGSETAGDCSRRAQQS